MLALGLALALGDSEVDGLIDLLADLDALPEGDCEPLGERLALPDGDVLADGLLEAEADLEALAEPEAEPLLLADAELDLLSEAEAL